MKNLNIKIALFGNMNNNHFAIKRYLEDQNFQCDLFLYNTLPSHFFPENDTWEIEKHQKSIKKLNRGTPILDIFKKRVNIDFNQYDISIGTGLSPYYSHQFGLKLDVFLPYGSDLYELPFKKSWSFSSFKTFLICCNHNLFVYKKQHQGILSTQKIFTINHVKSIQDALFKLNRISLPYSTPMVYIEKIPSRIDLNPYLDLKKMKSFDFKIISHSRQMWGKSAGADSKGNDKLIKGFSLFANKNKKACLVLFEYGQSINESKKLIADLNISDRVIWVKKIPRKCIYVLLSKYADMGADQFDSGYFGSTSYELMAHGLPVLNYLNLNPEEFEKKLGRPIPPILNVKNPEQISESIQRMFVDHEARNDLGKKAKDYFKEYLGQGAADIYIKEILRIYKTKIKFLKNNK